MSQTEKHSVTEKKIFFKRIEIKRGHALTISIGISNSTFNDCINMNFMSFQSFNFFENFWV